MSEDNASLSFGGAAGGVSNGIVGYEIQYNESWDAASWGAWDALYTHWTYDASGSHVTELRTAIDQIVALVNGWDTGSTTHDISLPAWIAITENKPTAAVINQLRAAIPLL